MAQKPTRVLIVGGGIGGLAAAVGLRRAGVEVSVFERSREVGEVGSAFFLWTNGMKALQELGLADEVEALGDKVERSEYRNSGGKLLVDWSVGDVARKLGAPNVAVPRSDLQRVLAGAARDDLRLERECTGFTQDDSGVTVQFADGSEEQGDVVIAADGLHSRIAEQAGLQTELRYGGYSVLRAVTPFEHPKMPAATFAQNLGRGTAMLFLPVGQGRVYWAASEVSPQSGKPPADDLKAWMLSTFKKYADPIVPMIEATPPDQIRWLEIFDREPKARWGESRLTLMGDAAHAMLPTMAQGACQSLEDGVVLSKCLAESGDPVAALRTYESRRMERANGYVNHSQRIAKMGGSKNPIACAIRDRMLPRVMAKMIPRREAGLKVTF
jgi:2-polyprenyl-6-methoxyphenol hydroxylase-like FAD-dependent oxidoreductase